MALVYQSEYNGAQSSAQVFKVANGNGWVVQVFGMDSTMKEHRFDDEFSANEFADMITTTIE
jgi:hypothetical protein